MKKILVLIFVFAFLGCTSKRADLLIHNAVVYTVNSGFDVVSSFAVKDGKIIAVGGEELVNTYKATQIINAEKKAVFPGLIDAHCHFYGLGMNLQRVNLVGTKSVGDVLKRLIAFSKNQKTNFIVGRGWDQNDWLIKIFPDKTALDSLYPDIPVVLERIDGHAYWVNQKALDMAGINERTPDIAGGTIIRKKGIPTGILIDAPMEKIEAILPKKNRSLQIKGLLDAQKVCFSNGLTTVNDAGLDKDIIFLMDSLQKANILKIRIYAMVSNKKENIDYFLERPPYRTEKINVSSVKVYADGALGSRGATLKKVYEDAPNHYGVMITFPKEIEKLATKIAATKYQMNTHAIGDSAISVVLKIYDKVLKNKKDPRWKIEHTQIIDPNDIFYFSSKIIPSVQPTHATSDMYWVAQRLGKKRLVGAYAFKDLLNQSKKIVLGTDFPVEKVNPFLTFFAATARQDTLGFPRNGFLSQNKLSREATLKGMTIWAAYSNFEEKNKGSIEIGKWADFIILNQDIMKTSLVNVPKTKVVATYLGGERVFFK